MLNYTPWLRACAALALLATGLAALSPAADTEARTLRLRVDFSADQGQNLGSLFEMKNEAGDAIAGAGFLGAYNTQPRSDRQQLQVYVRTREPQAAWQIERLPDVPCEARGYYPFGLEGRVYVLSRSGPDARVWQWDETTLGWIEADGIAPYTEQVAGRRLSVTSSQVSYDNRTLLDFSSTDERIGNHYFAGGNLILRLYAATDPPTNQLVVYPWRPESEAQVQENTGLRFDLTMPNEFVYTFGQWRDHILVATNYGGVMRLEGQRWTVLRAPVLNVSYQIYAALNYEGRLLLGHYPTGEIFEYAGGDLKLLRGWPPRLDSVSPSARETQTLTLYGGDLYAGVWPWAEVWRLNRNTGQWGFVQRMFTHPEPTDETVHPYDKETLAVDTVLNLWGQRVTGLIPSGNSLIITTSSKSGLPWEPKFDFLSPQQRADYGAIYRATLPGNLAVPTRWKAGPTEFVFVLKGEQLTIEQDGEMLGTVMLTAEQAQALQSGHVTLGSGVFGPLSGQLLEP